MLIQENLPLAQEAGQQNTIVDHLGTENINDASSFNMEEPVHEENEVHEVKETQVQDKTEASEIKEIAYAGCSSTEQVNNLT